MTIFSELVGTCAVCLRRHNNIGWSPSDRHPVKWTCKPCLRAAEDPILVQRVYQMPRKRLDEFEERAIIAGGEEAGAYLDELGKTDLATLHPDEWQEFGARWLVGYANAMRDMVANHAAPF